MQAAEMEHIAIARLLMDRGADPNHPGYRGYTPLHIAVDISIDGTVQNGGHPGDEPTEMIELLLERGASAKRLSTGREATALRRSKPCSKPGKNVHVHDQLTSC